MKLMLFAALVLLFMIWRSIESRPNDDELVYYDGCDLEALRKNERKLYIKAAIQIFVAAAFIVAVFLFL